MLKPEVLRLGPRWRIRWYVGVYSSRDETESLCRPDLYSSTRCIIPYINGLESSSLYTRNTSWCSVHYMILNKPLVRLTTVHYQSAVSMISLAQVLTAQWSNTIPCRNNISRYSVSTLPLNWMYLWQSNFGPKLLHFDDWQGLGEQICWVFFSSNMEWFYNLFFILFPNIMMSDVDMLCLTFDCWIYHKKYHSLVVQA